MKVTSRYALLAALGVSISALSATGPALAKKKDEAAAAPAVKISDDVRKPLGAAQEALNKGDLAAAEAQLAVARAASKTPDDAFVTAQIGLNVAVKSGDHAKQVAALDALIATGRVAEADKAKFYGYQADFAYQDKDYRKAEQAYVNAMAAGSTDPDIAAKLADSQFRNGNSAAAVATLQKVIDARAAAGQPVPTEWYGRGADIASRAKLVQPFLGITTAWLKAYPTKQNWHDTLFIYRQMAGLTGNAELDLLRLARYAGVLQLSAQSNYVDYALAVYLRYPNEAVSVLKEGVAAGKLNLASSQNAREILALSEPKIAADKASLKGAEAAANGPKATFKSVLSTGDVYYGYGQLQQAADMYKLAMTKPGADAGVANLRLGAALAQAGNKEGAKAAFSAVTGPEAGIAQYWMVLLDHPAA